MKKLLKICLILFAMNGIKNSEAQISFGVFADCQYADSETVGNRYYRNSLSKLNECILEFNQNKSLEFVVGMGDLIDKNISSFDSVFPVLDNSIHRVYQIIGNHDLAVEKNKIELVPEKMGLKNTYYSLTKQNWRFIFLNGNEITLSSNNPKIKSKAEEMISELSKKNKPNNQTWNGGIGKTQLNWLKRELKSAKKAKEKVIVFCHYPVLPLESHTLFNSEKVINCIEKYDVVKLYLNGHNHKGNYFSRNGIHYLTLQGMVETEFENSFASITLSDNKIEIEGFGREESRILEF